MFLAFLGDHGTAAWAHLGPVWSIWGLALRGLALSPAGLAQLWLARLGLDEVSSAWLGPIRLGLVFRVGSN